MAQEILSPSNRAVASFDKTAPNFLTIPEAYEDFILSREAMMVSAGTLRFYHFTAEKFVEWLTKRGKKRTVDITSRDVRSYINELVKAGKKPNYVNGHARAIRTFLKFCHEEKYIPEPVKFVMPPTSRARLPYLSADDLNKTIEACNNLRDKALVLTMVDTGVRRAELVALNWSDIDIKSGLVQVRRGKGGKSRAVVIGAKTRRALLAYRRTIEHIDTAPVFQTDRGTRLTVNGLRSLLVRLSKRSGVHITPHALRRTFATLALRAGMTPLHLQGLLGHTTLEMTRRYTQMVDDDLVDAHRDHGPVDNFLK